MKFDEKEQQKYEWIQYNAPYTDRQQSFVTTFFEKSLPFDKFKSTKIDWVIRNTDHEQFNYFEYLYNLYNRFSDKKLNEWIKYNEPFYSDIQKHYIKNELKHNNITDKTLLRKKKNSICHEKYKRKTLRAIFKFENKRFFFFSQT